MAAKVAVGCEPVVGTLTPSKKREYRVTNRLQEGKRPLYAVVFNFIDSRYFNVFATVGGNRVLTNPLILLLNSYMGILICFPLNAEQFIYLFLSLEICMKLTNFGLGQDIGAT